MEEQKIDKLIVSLCNHAKEILEEKGKLSPVAMILKQGQITPCFIPFNSPEEKTAIYLGLGAMMKQFGSVRIILINDAAMRVIEDPKEVEKFQKGKIDFTEQPLSYPESMRQDGILLMDVNTETGRSDGYFLRYENKKDAPRFYHELKYMNKDTESMGGDIYDWVMEGYQGSSAEDVGDFVKVRMPRSGGRTVPHFDGHTGIGGFGESRLN